MIFIVAGNMRQAEQWVKNTLGVSPRHPGVKCMSAASVARMGSFRGYQLKREDIIVTEYVDSGQWRDWTAALAEIRRLEASRERG